MKYSIMTGVQEINQERKRAIHNLSRKEVIKKNLNRNDRNIR